MGNYPSTSSYDYLLPSKIEKIGFNDHIDIASTTFVEVHHYKRTFETKIAYKACIVKLNIDAGVREQEYYYVLMIK